MKKKLVIFVPLCVMALTSCGFGGTTIVTSENSVPAIDPGQPDSGDGYAKASDFAFNLQDVKKTTGQVPLPSKGESHLLVVPVQFQNGPSWTSSRLEVIRKGFFGAPSETAWQSVSSFYSASSYGNLNIKGEIATPLYIPISTSEASKHTSSGQPSPDEYALSYFNSTSQYDSLRVKYDRNSDGLIDSIVFVYSNAVDSDNGYWAWVYWASDKQSLTRPGINSYLWMSYDFFADSKYSGYGSKVDAHTAIHETGHLLGLDDYYQYDKDDKFDPSGAIEMHSYNIGDDNIYSKFALGWVNPYYVKTDSSVTLKLRSSAYYGDAIIINDSWNGNSMDEYLIIEYYTPEGMNEKDAKSVYTPNGKRANRMYTVNGFRIYHIDSRIVELDIRGKMKDYANSIGKGYYAVGASNSPSRSRLPGQNAIDYKYVHLLESSGINSFKTGECASNETLFKAGSSFSASAEFFPNGSSFNSGVAVGYRVDVSECGTQYGSITITKL